MRTTTWTASIRRANATNVMTVYPRASLDEGLITLLGRVKAAIDGAN